MCLKASPHDPCLYTGSPITGGGPIYIGLYVDDFVYFRKYDRVEKNSPYPYHPRSKLTGGGSQTGFLAPRFNCPVTIKAISRSISSSHNFLNTHQNTLALETVTWTPSLHHNSPVSLFNLFPSQNYPQHNGVYARIGNKA